jgi:hypothetical protein
LVAARQAAGLPLIAVGDARLALGALEAPGLDFLTALFGAFHLDSNACARS